MELRCTPTPSMLHRNHTPGLGPHHTSFTPLPSLVPSAQGLVMAVHEHSANPSPCLLFNF